MAGKVWLIVLGVVVVLGLAFAVHQMATPGEPRVALGRGGWATGQDIATPLVASVNVRSGGGSVAFSLNLRDAKGQRLRSVQLPNGRRPAAPRVDVLDAEGQRIYQCTMQYG